MGLNDPIGDFCISEKRCCFWAGVVMQTLTEVQSKPRNKMVYFEEVFLLKMTENTLLQ
jgi:hypothetical protein